MKRFFAGTCIAALSLMLLIFGAACAEKENEDNAPAVKISLMSDDELLTYAELGEYKQLSIELSGRTRGEAAWETVREKANIKSYPKAQVEYYLGQAEAQYKYYAEQAGVSYEEMLAELEVSEESMLADARRMAIDDVIFELVRRNEEIELTDAEKEGLFDKYVKKYVEDYGYTEEYVKQNLAELIYESMLYDKTTEFLIANNSFN
ncbi:MAG: hypothetical protein J6L85_01665 [Clostridia bacterium]|nr:hypothetical protein [Clostridia bacterium]